MQSMSQPLMQIAASESLLQALTKLSHAADPGALSAEEAFELAALRFMTARALLRAARGSRHAWAV